MSCRLKWIQWHICWIIWQKAAACAMPMVSRCCSLARLPGIQTIDRKLGHLISTGFSIHHPPACVPAPGQFAGHRPRRAIHTSEHPISPPSEPTFVRYLRIRGILVYRIASWFIMFMLLGLRPTVGPAAVSGSLTSFVGGINRRFARRSYRQEFVTCFTSPGVVSRLTAGSRQGSESQWTKTQRCSQAAPGAFLPMNFPQKIPEEPKI